MKLRRKKSSGFTLLELMIAVAVLVVVLIGLLGTYIACIDLNETTRNANLALFAAQNRMEAIRNSARSFVDIASAYNGKQYNISGMLNGSGLLRVSAVKESVSSTLINVTIGACWRQRRGRIIGDCNWSGGTLVFLNSSGNGILNSPVQIVSQVLSEG